MRRRIASPISTMVAIGFLASCWALASTSQAQDDPYVIDDSPRQDSVDYPDWFLPAFLDLPEDLSTARAGGKDLMLYFGQAFCPYCHRFLQVNLGMSDIKRYTQAHFEVVPIDIWGAQTLKDLQGNQLSEREFAIREEATFTPALIFFDEEGQEALRLIGYYPPYQFRAALEYVADDHYKRESFRDYLLRGENRMVFGPEDLNEEDFFSSPPHIFDRSRVPGARPLAVFFERGDCHPCDVLHGEVLQDPVLREAFSALDSAQLDLNANTPVITPQGLRTDAASWARELGLFYAPAVVFFDPQGREILRVDSVVGFYRLSLVMDYINSGDYQREPSFQRWRLSRLRTGGG